MNDWSGHGCFYCLMVLGTPDKGTNLMGHMKYFGNVTVLIDSYNVSIFCPSDTRNKDRL